MKGIIDVVSADKDIYGKESNNDTFYQVNEMFWTIQGEGGSAGRTAVFIRLQGCPVGCPWCDSKTTWLQGGTRMSVHEILQVIQGLPKSDLIIVTGGEPLLYDLDALFLGIDNHFDYPREIHIETSGMFPYKGRIVPQKMVISPKYGYGPSLKKPHFYVDESVWIAAFGASDYELKYVVDKDFTEEIVSDHMLRANRWLMGVNRHWKLDPGQLWERLNPEIFLMPEGSPPSSENVVRTLKLLETHRSWKFGPRLQYAYPDIAKMEGLNNHIISKEEAFRRAREAVGVKTFEEKEGVPE